MNAVRTGRRELRRPPRWLTPTTGFLVAILLWGLTGWTWTVPAIAVGAALIVRILGFLLPRAVRNHIGPIATSAAVLALLAQSSIWAVLLAVGLAIGAFALVQPHTIRIRGVLAAGVLVLAGTTGLIVVHAITQADDDRSRQQTRDYYRARLLPSTPREAVRELMALVARGDPIACTRFNEPGRNAFSNAYHATDCPDAISAAHARIADPHTYEYDIDNDTITTQSTPNGVQINGCTIRWTGDKLGEILNGTPQIRPNPGPTLGTLIVVPSGYGTGWVISDFRPC